VPLRHSYLRLSPENRAGVYGPADPTAPAGLRPRHPVLAGLDDTDTLPFGGLLPAMRAGAGVEVLATWVPEFPIYPPETSWMRQPTSDVPALAVRETPGGGRLVWSLADLDRCYAREGSFEHALILANAVRWALRDRDEARIEGGDGLAALTGYGQGARRILHVNSRIVTSPVPGRQDALPAVGPVKVSLRWPEEKSPAVSLRVSGAVAEVMRNGARIEITLPPLPDHEVIVVE
jgi:hypothetical protein